MSAINNDPELASIVEKYVLAEQLHLSPLQVDEMSKSDVEAMLFVIDTIKKSRKLHS